MPRDETIFVTLRGSSFVFTAKDSVGSCTWTEKCVVHLVQLVQNSQSTKLLKNFRTNVRHVLSVILMLVLAVPPAIARH
jgi:hypothetical protein